MERHIQTYFPVFLLSPLILYPTDLYFSLFCHIIDCHIIGGGMERSRSSDKREKTWRLGERGQACARLIAFICKEAMNQSPIFANEDFNILNCQCHY